MVNREAEFGSGIVNRKSRAVIGVYVLDRYSVGGFAVAGIMDSKGTERGLGGPAVELAAFRGALADAS
jgi:hypothetical protein